MATKTKTPHTKIAFFLPKTILAPEKRLLSEDAPAWAITLRPVVVGRGPDAYQSEVIADDRIANPNDRTLYNGLFLNGLEIVAWAREEADGVRRVWHYEYRFDVYKVDRSNVHRLAKTIKTIDARMDQITKRDGYVKDFPDFLRRMAEALKVTSYVESLSDRGWSYSENEHRFLSLGDGLNRIHHAIAQWQREPEERKAASA